MGESGRGQGQRLVQEQLPRSRRHQVVAADHIGDAHGGIIDNHGQLIGGSARRLPDHEIPAQGMRLQRDAAKIAVLKRDAFRPDPQTPGKRPMSQSCRICHFSPRTGPWIRRFPEPKAFSMRGTGSALDIAAAAGAGIDQLLALQFLKSGLIEG